MKSYIYNFVILNIEWIFSGIGVLIISIFISMLKLRFEKMKSNNIRNDMNIVFGNSTNINIGNKSDKEIIDEIKTALGSDFVKLSGELSKEL